MKKKYTCSDYREEMILLGLKRQLNKDILSKKEKQAIIIEIKKIEQMMGLN